MLADVGLVVGGRGAQGRVVGEQPLSREQAQAGQSVAQEVERGRGEAQGRGQGERQPDGVGEELGRVLQVVTAGVTRVEFIARDLRGLLLDSDWGLGLVLLQILLLHLVDETRNGEGFLLGFLCLRAGEGRGAGRRRRSLTGRWWKNSSRS